MTAGAVVASRGAARAPIGAEAVGPIVWSLAFLPGLAQGGGAEGHLAELACEARGAEAREGSWEIQAAGSRGTRPTQTLVHFCLTAWPFKAWEALAEEGSRLVLALPTVGAGGARTLIHVLLTPGARVSLQADAQEAAEQVPAVSSVQARRRGALIGLHLA